MSLKQIQQEILENKRRQGFNTTNIEQEFCYLYGEVGEAYEAYYKQKPTFPEELADVAIFLLGIAEIKGIDLEAEITKKVEINKTRHYQFNDLGKPIHD
jgi:NTP pyrophosphatase (non-canonical NTP hydrolase)